MASILTIVTVATVTWSQIASPPKTARGFISSELDPRILRALESTVEGRFVGPPLGTVQAALGWPISFNWCFTLSTRKDALNATCHKEQAVVTLSWQDSYISKITFKASKL